MHTPKTVIIVGNGYIPYLIALCIQQRFAPELVIVDLGEPSQPELIQSLGSMKDFHSDLNVPEADFVKKTKAEINLGFDYSGFSKANGRGYGNSNTNSNGNEMLCDAQYGFNLNNRRFYHLFNKFRQFQSDEKLEDYCLSAKLARGGRFTPPSPKANSLYHSIRYGYRLTSAAYAMYLKSKLSPSNTKVVPSKVESVRLDHNGFVESIDVGQMGNIKGDFFIDASESRIMRRPLNQACTLRPQLPQKLDLELSSSITQAASAPPYSSISITQAGMHADGTYLKQNYRTSLIVREGSVQSSSGPRRVIDSVPWLKNCVAVGHAVTNRISIMIDNSHLHQSMVLRLLELWPRSFTMEKEAQAYNANTRAEFKQISDLDALHLAQAFNRPEILSDEIRYKLDIFKRSGKVAYYEKELLQEEQWPVLFNAIGVVPDTPDLSVRNCTDEWLKHELFRIKGTVEKAAEAAPLYQDFIRTAHR